MDGKYVNKIDMSGTHCRCLDRPASNLCFYVRVVAQVKFRVTSELPVNVKIVRVTRGL